MLLETSEDKLLARGVAFEDVQFGSLVRNFVPFENVRKGLYTSIYVYMPLVSKIMECLFDQTLSSRQNHLIDHLMWYSLRISFNIELSFTLNTPNRFDCTDQR